MSYLTMHTIEKEIKKKKTKTKTKLNLNIGRQLSNPVLNLFTK